MPRQLDGLDENLRILRNLEEGCDFDRRVAEMIANGEVEPYGPVEPPPGTDRASLDWLWAEPEADEDLAVQAPVTIPFRQGRGPQIAAWIGAAAVAASVLFAAGLFIGRGGGDASAPLLAQAVITKASVRGPGSVDALRIESRSDARAFLTLVGLAPGRRAGVLYRSDQKFIEVAPRGVLDLEVLPASFDGSRAVLVVLSPTPMGEAVRQVADGLATAEPAQARENLSSGLSALGYRGFSIEVATPAAK